MVVEVAAAEECRPDNRLFESNDVRLPLQRSSLDSPSCNSRSGMMVIPFTDKAASDIQLWKSTLYAELVSTHEYLRGINSIDLLDFCVAE